MKVACASNLKQLGVASATYSASSDRFFVASSVRHGSLKWYTWDDHLRPYIGLEDMSWEDLLKTAWPEDQTTPLLKCPGSRAPTMNLNDTVNISYMMPTNPDETGSRLGYSIDLRPNKDPGPPKYYRMSSVESHSSVFLLSEVDCSFGATGNGSYLKGHTQGGTPILLNAARQVGSDSNSIKSKSQTHT